MTEPQAAEAARRYLAETLESEGVYLGPLSLQLGRNHAYIEQYIKRGKPRWLREPEREALVAAVPALDPERLKPPPKQLHHGVAKFGRSRKGHDEPQINPPRTGKFVDDPSTIELLDIWGNIRHAGQRQLALRILRLMADQDAPAVA